MNMVTVENLSVTFGSFYAVKDVSFSVSSGEIFGFLGANGAGKTTTIRVLCGLLIATSGRVVIDNVEASNGTEKVIKQKVGYMSQKFTLYDDLTIEENLEFAASLRGIYGSLYKTRKDKLLDFIDFKNDKDQIVSTLPGGIKQEIALVASLLHDPKIIFLDEPTAGVAPVARDKFWKLIKQLASDGKTIFVTTHYMDEAENCNRIALMKSGELIALDTPENLKSNTYRDDMYMLTPRDENSRNWLLNNSELFDMLSPYGLHYHAVFSKQVDKPSAIDQLDSYCNIRQVSPSLEDVFIKLVEGDR